MNTKEFLEEFEKISNELLSTVRAKNSDYCGDKDPFKNFKLAEFAGICSAERGILTRMLDKVARVTNLLDKPPAVASESVQDTLKDLAAYTIILSIYLSPKHNSSPVPVLNQKEMAAVGGRLIGNNAT